MLSCAVVCGYLLKDTVESVFVVEDPAPKDKALVSDSEFSVESSDYNLLEFENSTLSAEFECELVRGVCGRADDH